MLGSFPKHNAAVVLANQTIEDFDSDLQRSVLGSVGSFLILRQGLSAACLLEELTQPRFDDRDLMTLPDYEAVFRTDVTGGRGARRVALRPPGAPSNSALEVAELRQLAADRIGRPREEVEADILRHLVGGLP